MLSKYDDLFQTIEDLYNQAGQYQIPVTLTAKRIMKSEEDMLAVL